jgi:hypothetical protein
VQELGTGDPRERPVRLGGMLVTLVEPHAGHEVAYNRWYERDHFYAGCMIGAWTLSGARFVATNDCKARRYSDDSPITDGDNSRGSYLALYWILRGHFGDWMQWGTEQVRWLHANDRMFEHRDHVHTGMYKLADDFERDGGVPTELALDRRFPGLVLTIGQLAAGVDPMAAGELAWEVGGDVLVVGTAVPLQADAPSDVPRDDTKGRFVALTFVDDDPLATWDAGLGSFGERMADAGLGRVLFSSPFLPTIPGTDTYTDQLR